MRPEYAPRQPAAAGQPGKLQSVVADHIYVTVPLTRIGRTGPRRARCHRERICAGCGVSPFEASRTAWSARSRAVRLFCRGSPHAVDSHHHAAWERRRCVLVFVSVAFFFLRRHDHPRLAVVIDDLGTDRAQADALFRLSYPLTLSVLPYHSGSTEIAEEAHRRGYQVMLHLPMASNAGDKDEPIELHPGMDTASVEKTFSSMLETVPYAAGVNNHEGSLGTSDQKLMDELMPVLHQDRLFFIDSRTTAATVAETAAHAARVPAASRNVFLDDDQSAASRPQSIRTGHSRRPRKRLGAGHWAPHPGNARRSALKCFPPPRNRDSRW